jgi:hypothetical protein
MTHYRIIPLSPSEILYLPVVLRRARAHRWDEELIAYIPALPENLAFDHEPIVMEDA